MFRITVSLIPLIFSALFVALPVVAAQTDQVKLIRDSGAITGTIPGRTGSDCILASVQYEIEIQASDPSIPLLNHIFLRAKQNVDLYIRFGEQITVENGRIVADYVRNTPTGIEDFSFPADRPGIYFAAVSNCSEVEAEYSILFRVLGDFPLLPAISRCELIRNADGSFFLHLNGMLFKEGAIVTLNQEPVKKLKFKKPTLSEFSKIVVKSQVCRKLPGVIQITNPDSFPSVPFMCFQRCPN
jgi:hypothetical protein